MKNSLVAPSNKCEYLLSSIRSQTVKSLEIILVIKNCDFKAIDYLCRRYSLKCIVIEHWRTIDTSNAEHGVSVQKAETIAGHSTYILLLCEGVHNEGSGIVA